MKARKSLVFFTSLPAVGGHTTSTLGLVKLLREEFRDIFVVAKEMPGHGVSPEAKALLQDWGAQLAEIPAGKSLGSTLLALQSCVLGGGWHRPSSFLAMGMRNLAPVLAFALRPQHSVYFHITHELTPATSRTLNSYGLFLLSGCVHFAGDVSGLRGQGTEGTSVGVGTCSERAGIHSRPTKQRSGTHPVRFYWTTQRGKGLEGSARFFRTPQEPCEMHVAGGGEFESAFTAIQTQANRTSPVTVKYWGKFSVADRQKFFSSFFPTIDYLIVPTQDEMEGIPGVILESLQFGVPVVATRTGGITAFAMKELGPAEADVVRLVPKDGISEYLASLASQQPPSEAIVSKCKAYYARHFSDAVLREHWSKLLGAGKKGL